MTGHARDSADMLAALQKLDTERACQHGANERVVRLRLKKGEWDLARTAQRKRRRKKPAKDRLAKDNKKLS